MPRCFLLLAFVFLVGRSSAQDSLYTRKMIEQLCSKDCYGRGYVNNGLKKASKLLALELKAVGATPLFGDSYFQTFSHPVNVFDGQTKLILNGQLLKVGRDYIPDAAAPSVKGRCTLSKKDSVTFIGQIWTRTIKVVLKQKLTWTVARKNSTDFIIEVDRHKFNGMPESIEIAYGSRLIPDFKSQNLGCRIKGSSGSDSVIVFSAHYDHLGGIGKDCYFPGANDNASGVSMVLNLLHYYTNHPPKYTTVFLFFAGEEAGLLGSAYFTESGQMDLQKIKFLINLDLLGTGDDGIMVVNGAIHQKEFERLNELNAKSNLLPQIRKRGKAANSDHYWFTEKGVPAFFVYTMGGISAYHDVYDRPETLPLTRYQSVFKLLTEFVSTF